MVGPENTTEGPDGATEAPDGASDAQRSAVEDVGASSPLPFPPFQPFRPGPPVLRPVCSPLPLAQVRSAADRALSLRFRLQSRHSGTAPAYPLAAGAVRLQTAKPGTSPASRSASVLA